MIDFHFTGQFFWVKCKCMVSGHCARIERSLHLSVSPIGSRMVTMVMMAMMVMVVGGVGVVGMVGMVGVVSVATIEVQAIIKVAQVVISVADASFIPMVQSLVQGHLWPR